MWWGYSPKISLRTFSLFGEKNSVDQRPVHRLTKNTYVGIVQLNEGHDSVTPDLVYGTEGRGRTSPPIPT